MSLDLRIENGTVVTATGSFRANIGIADGRIALISSNGALPAATRTIDAGGQIVAPGFIDIHNHARENIFELPSADNYVRQGVTTLIEGPDGSSPVPIAPFFATA